MERPPRPAGARRREQVIPGGEEAGVGEAHAEERRQ